MKMKNILLIVGTTVGAGIFSLPLVFKQTGLLPFFLLLIILAFVTLRLNIYFAEITHSIKQKHQLPGYVSIVLSKKMGVFSILLHLFSTYGALIAFASIGGTFLSHLLGTRPEIGRMLFFAIATGLLLFSGSKMEKLDEVFAAGKGILFALLIVVAFLFYPFSKYHQAPLIGTSPYLAYGLILFSLTGFSIIPELHPEKQYKKTIWMAQFLIVLLYLIFTVALSPYVIGGAFQFANPLMAAFVNVTGLVSVFTTYLLLSLVTKDVYRKDIKMNEKGAFGFTAGIPFLAIFFHVDGFMKMLSLTGGIFLGGIGLFICEMHQSIYPEKNKIERILIQLLLVSGVILELLVR
jgi:amino acid permease